MTQIIKKFFSLQARKEEEESEDLSIGNSDRFDPIFSENFREASKQIETLSKDFGNETSRDSILVERRVIESFLAWPRVQMKKKGS